MTSRLYMIHIHAHFLYPRMKRDHSADRGTVSPSYFNIIQTLSYTNQTIFATWSLLFQNIFTAKTHLDQNLGVLTQIAVDYGSVVYPLNNMG